MKIKRSLGLKISLCFLSVALLPVVAISILSSIQVKRNTADIIKEDLSQLVYQAGTEIERTVFYAYTHIKSLADNLIIKSESAKTAEKLAEMQKISDFYKIFEDITLVNLDGEVLVSTTYEYRGKWKYKDWFKQAKEGKAVVSPVHALLDPFRLVMVTTAPVLGEDGAVKAVVAGRVNMQIIWEITDKIKIGKTGFVFLTDKAGNLIAFPDKERLLYKITPGNLKESILTNQDGTTEYKTNKSTDKFCYYSILKGYGDYKGQEWRIGITQNVKEIYAIVNKMQIQLLSIAGGCFIFVIVLASVLTRNIVGPIKHLAEITKKIAGGNLNNYVSVTTRDEIADLGYSFNQMVRDLKKTTVSRDHVDNVIKSMIDPLIVVTTEGKLSTLNRAVLNLLGYKIKNEKELMENKGEFLDKKINQVFPEEFTEGIMSYAKQVLRTKEISVFEYDLLRLKDGLRNLEIRCVAINEAEALVVIRDITEQKQAEEKLKKTLKEAHTLTLMDELTKLYNRRGFLTLAQQQMNIASRYKEEMILIFIDLDNMKWINDSLGHKEGDRALFEIADILRHTFRESDIIARMGGDEFAVLIVNITRADASNVINRLRNNLETLNIKEPRGYKRSLSIGMAFYDIEHPCSINEMLEHADKMMYEEKKNKQKT